MIKSRLLLSFHKILPRLSYQQFVQIHQHKPPPLPPPPPHFEWKPETDAEIKYRLKRAEYDDWRETVWLKHLDDFYKQGSYKEKKPLYNTEIIKEKNVAINEWKWHLKYIAQYYRKNLELLNLSFQASELPLIKRGLKKIFRIKT